MAQGEPEPKKLKKCIVSDHVYTAKFQRFFAHHWHNRIDVEEGNLQVLSKPFRVCRISNFLRDEDFMDDVKNELLDVKSRRNSIDLYQFEQSNDLANVDGKSLKLLYETFRTDLALWMEKNTEITLNKNISMSSSCYSDTDYLLCHDDNMGDRRIAFVLYLSKDWTAEDGGALDLFDTDEHGQPRNVVKSLVPQYNSLVFFEVEDNSYHQVAEVVSPVKSRWTINGWFHGPLITSSRPPRPEIEIKYVEPINARVELDSWITKCYLVPSIIKEIHQDIERESFSFLSNFFKKELYETLSMELTSETIVWEKVGPADIRNYEVAREETLPELLKAFYNMFKSVSMLQLLKDYTELDLVPGKGNANPKLTIELQRWSQGCYTLICDKSVTNETDASENSNANANQGEERCDGEDARTTEVEESRKRNASNHGASAGQKEDEDGNEEEILRRILKGKSPKSRKKNSPQSPPCRPEDTSPRKIRSLDTDDSDVSDIGDYLSDPLDCSGECSDDEAADEPNTSEPGSLDVILQFHTDRSPDEETIDYVEPKEQEGALIHVPAKDNHLCLVYKTLSTCRLHKYVNHYCEGYFYNLIGTYFE